MESYLMITQINDFIFCPRSIYFHDVYRESVGVELYQQTPQKIGLAEHAAIDSGNYSSRNDILMGTTVYCEKYRLLGKIDLFNKTKGVLSERKYSITAVYDGFRYQLYAQYFALSEMGFFVKSMRLYSKKDNKIYPIELPNEDDIRCFDKVLTRMRTFRLTDVFFPNLKKCERCIYRSLCDVSPVEQEY